ncbi:hypothetical protein L208DRAFT_1438051 [Tricholoma matsutake]|nr:hypothetical protein L208DRAFT_1438051 [Tricholoma matsutake 945]
MNTEDGPQSSEEGSGLQSPVFGAAFPSPHGGSFRYQHDQLEVQRAAAILVPQYDYSTALNVQQPPLLDTTLELPNTGAQHVTFSSHIPLPPRNHLAHDFSALPLPSARLSPDHGSRPMGYRYNNTSSDRRLPGGYPHDHSYTRHAGNNAVSTDDDRRPPPVPSSEIKEASPIVVTNSPRQARKEVSTTVIACRQCRGRKIRCDSTRPVCNNCVRRSNVCEYDAVPKRRGPDKRPGTRQRSCKKRPADGSTVPLQKRKKIASDYLSDARDTAPSRVKENMADKRSPASSRHSDRLQDIHTHTPGQQLSTPPTELRNPSEALPSVKVDQSPIRRHLPYGYEPGFYIKSSFPRQLDVNILRSPDTAHQKFPIPSSPAMEIDQKLWWENFIRSYPLKEIDRDLSYLFKDAGSSLSFVNIEFFLKRLWHPEDRLKIQPAFILAGLAVATLMKSSECEYKAPGRDRALWLRNAAQGALEQALASEWVDASLAEAALMLALFESSAHPHYSPDRLASSLILLDDIIRDNTLTTIDANDRDVSSFPAGCVPTIHLEGPEEPPGRKCACIPSDAVHPPNPFTSWSYTLPWDSSWTDVQIRDEECRRLCWTALSLICDYTSQCVAFNKQPPNFFLSDSGNYALLFPGEVLDRMSPSYRAADSPSTKESVWALYCRSMLLWSFCHRLGNTSSDNDDLPELIFDAWAETQALLDSLKMHDCNLDTAIIYLCREYIYNTQITITQTLRSLQGLSRDSPMFTRKQAEEWLWYQDRVVQAVKLAINHLGSVQGYQLTRRPFQVPWCLNQLSICLLLWNYDRSLKNALVLAKSIMLPVEVMNALWPCPALQRQSDDLRQRLIDACAVVGFEPPIPSNFTLPSL